MRIDVWSDIACPWCFIGKRRLESALSEGLAQRVEVVWRVFELDPAAPRGGGAPALPYAERLARKYGSSVGEAQESIRRMTEVAAGEGLDLRFDAVRPANTFDAHRVLHLARERGVQDAAKERLLRAYFSEGADLDDVGVLEGLAVDAGLDRREARELLAGRAFSAEVRADETEAARLGIHGVPFFVLGGRYAVSGAQPAAVLRAALERALAEEAPGSTTAAGGDPDACGPGGCATP